MTGRPIRVNLKSMSQQQSTLKVTIYFIIALCSIIGYYTSARRLVCLSDSIERARTTVQTREGLIKRALFCPDDNVLDTLLGLIEAEKEQIFVATFSFTNKEIARALIEAHERGVHIEVVADRSNAQSTWSKVYLLAQAGIPTSVYPAQITDAIMHHKFMIFFNNLDGKRVLIDGSYNFTNSASSNEENVLVLEDQTIIEPFIEQFQKLKARSLCTSKEDWSLKKRRKFRS